VTSRPSPPTPPPLPALPAFAAGRLYALRVFLFAAFAVPLLLRRRIDRLAPWIEPAPSPEPPEPSVPLAALPPLSTDAVEALVKRIDRLLVARHPIVRSGCLTRGVTLYYFLRRAGVEVALRFGMGEIDGSFSGHCWLEYNGEPLVEPRDPRPLFVEMFRIPSSPSASGQEAPLAAAGGAWR
jgi:hypothetical protein